MLSSSPSSEQRTMLSCPLCYHNNPNYGFFHVTQLDCDIYIAFNIATVSIRGQYQNMSGYPTSGTYQVPLLNNDVNISSCNIYVNNQHYVTSVIDPSIVNISSYQSKSNNSNDSDTPNNNIPFNPSAFSVPFTNCPPNGIITVDVTYIQKLVFTSNGSYQLTIPLRIPSNNYSSNYQSISTIKCILDSGTPSCQYECPSHNMQVVGQNNAYVYPNNPYLLSGTAAVALQGSSTLQYTPDFVFNYFGYGTLGVTGTCLLETPSSHGDSIGNFVLHLSPAIPQSNPLFGRNMVFLLDHSGSMNGLTMSQAKSALQQAIQMLTPVDYFTICAFDDTMIWFQVDVHSSPILVRADQQTILYACQWIQQIEARGLTDILSPYQMATDLLSHPRTHQSISPHQVNGPYKIVPDTPESSLVFNLPIIFLVTDGAVNNEQEICRYAQSQASSTAKGVHKSDSRIVTRTFSFGIGPFVNPYFLKSLSNIGRGYAEICLHQDHITSNIVELMRRTYCPQLTDITIEIPQTIRDVEVYPLPIPDLYAGYPVTVAGKYSGNFPTTLHVKGKDSSGNFVRIPITVRLPYRPISLKKLFASFYLDYLVSKYWLTKDENIDEADKFRKNAAEVSCQTGVPCVFTQSVVYETKPSPPPSEIPHHDQSPTKPNQRGMSTSDAIVGGTLIALGATAAGLLMFGNVAATMNNVGIDQAFHLLNNLQLSSSTLQNLAGGMTHFANHLAQNATPIIQNIGRVGGNVAGHVGQSAAPVVQGMSRFGGEVVDNAGHVGGHVVNQVGHVGGQVVNEVGQVGAPIVREAAQVGGEACCASLHTITTVCRDVCKLDTLQSIGRFVCAVVRVLG